MNYANFREFTPKTYNTLNVPDELKGLGFVKAANGFLDYCANVRKLSPCTIRNRENSYRFFAIGTGVEDLSEITNKSIEDYMRSEIDRGVSPRTVNEHVRDVVRLVDYYREFGASIPLKSMFIHYAKEGPPRRSVYTREQILGVLEKCTSDKQWLLIRIIYDTGMRMSELTHLSVEQLHGRKIEFIGKGNKQRFAYLTPECHERLMSFLRRERIRHGRIWLNEWGYPQSDSTLRRIMRTHFRHCGYTDFYPHALRHSFASDLQRQHATPLEIMAMLGHSNVATTQRYLDSLGGELEGLYAKYRNY